MFLVWFYAAVPCIVGARNLRYEKSLAESTASKEEALGKGALPIGRYAFLLRGHTFREPGHRGLPCRELFKQRQLEQAQSLVNYVLQPLETAGSTSDLFLTMPHCFMNAELERIYGGHRIKFAEEADYPDQSSGFPANLKNFKQFLEKEKQAVDLYKFIFISRHDILFKSPITQLKANWSLLNYLSRCEPMAPDDCLNDAVEVIPSIYFSRFFERIGSECGCFKQGCARRDDGHSCRRQMENTGIEVGVLTDWRPVHKLREYTNTFGDIGPGFVSLEPAFAVPDEQAVSIHEHP
eukprot:TRINITY_DN13385_c0_g2_i1.p1 TRINITY_DN13385_c0_g2~~TRINITY_DN13385_c0_g2_i1.p1  ORF type:complete len:294 (+),score=32.12 TRINITY_DN13385_c0_g2_i1:63-944(+)